MTLYRQLEYELAEARGIDLRWLDEVSPETARNWRADNKHIVSGMHAAVCSKS